MHDMATKLSKIHLLPVHRVYSDTSQSTNTSYKPILENPEYIHD